MSDPARKTTAIVVAFFSVAVSGSDANLKLMLGSNQERKIPDRREQITKKKWP